MLEKCDVQLYTVDSGGDDGEKSDAAAWLSLIPLSERTNAHIESESKPKEVLQALSVYPGGHLLCIA